MTTGSSSLRLGSWEVVTAPTTWESCRRSSSWPSSIRGSSPPWTASPTCPLPPPSLSRFPSSLSGPATSPSPASGRRWRCSCSPCWRAIWAGPGSPPWCWGCSCRGSLGWASRPARSTPSCSRCWRVRCCSPGTIVHSWPAWWWPSSGSNRICSGRLRSSSSWCSGRDRGGLGGSPSGSPPSRLCAWPPVPACCRRGGGPLTASLPGWGPSSRIWPVCPDC